MQVPFFDGVRVNAGLQPQLEAAFRRVMSSGRFILGEEVEAFERRCAERLGVSCAVGVSSGSDALIAALMALDVGPGDEVICPAYTFVATAEAIARLGATPVFVDVAIEDGNSSAEEIEAAITPRTRAILVVHLFGRCADMAPIVALGERCSVPVIEDAAQAFGAGRDGRAAGTWGTCGCFSLFPTKNLGGMGDGGLAICNDVELARLLRRIRTHGSADKQHHGRLGGNFRLDALQAALLRVKLEVLDRQLRARRDSADRYRERLSNAGLVGSGLLLPPPTEPGHTYNQFVIRIPRHRDALRAQLERHGVATAVYYALPLHLQPCFAYLGGKRGQLPHAEQLAREALALPVFPGLTEGEIDHVCNTIIEFFRRTSRTL